MQDLQEVTHETHYENYRSEKLQPKKQIRPNDADTDEQQKKLIKEKDDEVNRSYFVDVCVCVFHNEVHYLFDLASSNARYACQNARSTS
jgi:septin family protein